QPCALAFCDDDTWVTSLATGLVEGRPVVVSGGTDGMLRVWDLAAGGRGGELLALHTGTVGALATAVLDGCPVAVTGHGYGTIRRWDLLTGREFGTGSDHAGESRVGTDPASGHSPATDGHGESDDDGDDSGLRRCITLEVNAMTHLLATDRESACPLAISANAYDSCVWDLATGELVGEPGPGFVDAAALTVLQGRTAALVACRGRGPVEVWDLSALRHRHLPLTGHEGTVRGVATAVVEGRHLAVTGGDDGSVRVWEFDGAKEEGSRPAGHVGPVHQVTTAVVEGRSVIVTGGPDRQVRIWDLDGGGEPGEPLAGHTAAVDLVTVGTVEGRPTLLTRDGKKTVRIWDLTTREELHGRLTGEYGSASIDFFAEVDGRFVAVTREGRVWDLAASRWIGVQPQHGGALALESLGGRNVILTGRRTEAVHLWDLATGERIGPPLAGCTGEVRAGAVGTLDGRPVVAAGGDDGTVRMWDATTGQPIGAYAFPSGIRALAVAPDGRLVVGFGADLAVLA
ncbi:hypothetical protein ABZ885_40870, partial [Kitasatospora sp. NPDC047058]